MRILQSLSVIAGLAVLGILAGHAATQPEKLTMRAVVMHTYGGPEVLKLEDLPRPEPKEDEILIRVVRRQSIRLMSQFARAT